MENIFLKWDHNIKTKYLKGTSQSLSLVYVRLMFNFYITVWLVSSGGQHF